MKMLNRSDLRKIEERKHIQEMRCFAMMLAAWFAAMWLIGRIMIWGGL